MFKFLFNLILLFNLFIYTNFCFSKTISVVTEAWYPYVYQNEKNEPAGIDYVKCKKIFDSLGIELKIEFLPWLRALDAVKKNEADGIIDIIKNPEREEFAIFSKQQLSKIELAVFYKKNKPFQYKNLDSFSGKKVAIMRGYGYPKNFQDAKNFTKVDITGPTGSERNFKKLIYDRVDFVIENKIAGVNILKKLNMDKNIISSDILLDSTSLYFAFSKKHLNSELVKLFNNKLSAFYQ